MARKTEGDVNEGKLRAAWRANLSASSRRLLEQDEACFFHQGLSTPCMDVIRSAKGIYITDAQGRKYMDFHGNSVHQVGYGNPHVIAAIEKQMRELCFSPRRYTNETAVRLALKLLRYMPGDYKILFSPSGAASNGMALKLARLYTGRHKVISQWDSFHGANLDTISVGGTDVFRRGVGPLLPGVEHIMPYNSYRNLFGKTGSAAMKNLDYLEFILEREEIGAVMLETIRSTDVQIPPLKYYKRLRGLCDRYHALLILDEIPIALGRTGGMFAFERYGIRPDVVTIGKGLGGGILPMSAMIAKSEFDCVSDSSIGHYTHEKSPVGCAAALATIEVIENEHLLRRAAELGAYFLRRLRALKRKYKLVGDVRAAGLLGAVELVTDRRTRAKATEQAERVLYKCLEKGLSFKVSEGNVITLSPPLIITREELGKAVDILDEALSEIR